MSSLAFTVNSLVLLPLNASAVAGLTVVLLMSIVVHVVDAVSAVHGRDFFARPDVRKIEPEESKGGHVNSRNKLKFYCNLFAH